MTKVINKVIASDEAKKIDELIKKYSSLIVDAIAAGMPLSQTLIYFKKNSPLTPALWSKIEDNVTRSLQIFQHNKIHLNGGVGAPEILAQNGSKLELRGFKPSFEQLADYSNLIAKSEGTKHFVGDKPLKVALDIIRKYSIDYGFQVKKLAEHLKAETPEQSAFNVWYFIKKNIKYEFDTPGEEELRTPARTWDDRQNPGVDCDDYAIFAAALLTQMGYQPEFRVVQFNNKKGYGHIYVVLGETVIDACLTRFNEHPQNITKSMKIYTLKGIDPIKGGDVNEDVNLGSTLNTVSTIAQGAMGALSSIGAAVPPPAGTIMGVIGGIGAAIASLFRGKPDIDPNEYRAKFKELIIKSKELAATLNENSPGPVLNSTNEAFLALTKLFHDGHAKLREEYNIPNELAQEVISELSASSSVVSKYIAINSTRQQEYRKALLVACAAFANGDISQAGNIATIYTAIYAWSPNTASPTSLVSDGVINYDPNAPQIVGGKLGTGNNQPTYTAEYTKEIFKIMEKAKAAFITSQGSYTPPGGGSNNNYGTQNTSTGFNTAGMGAGMKWALAAAAAFAGYKLMTKK